MLVFMKFLVCSQGERTRLVSTAEAEVLHEAMSLVCYPSGLNRQPRNLCYRPVYKASEWLHLLMYNLPLVFRMQNPRILPIVPPQVRRIILLLSTALHMLLADKASMEESKREAIERRADAAENLIMEFWHDCTRLFGSDYITYNFHQLLPLA